MRTPHPRLKVKERMRVLSPRSCVDRAVFLPDEKTEAAFEPGSMPVLTATGLWLFDFQPTMGRPHRARDTVRHLECMATINVYASGAHHLGRSRL